MRFSAVRTLTVTAMVVLSFAWSYWPTLCEMVAKWSSDPQYSHAYFVPAFALYLVWARRTELAQCSGQPSWWGLVPLLAGLVLRLAGIMLYFDWLEQVSLLPFLAGALLLLGGWSAFRVCWPAVAFLGFMFPLPYSLERALSQPLQSVATQVSTYALQTMGLPAFAEGNVIVLNESNIGVVEACNGLGMLVLFFALATGVAMLIRKPVLDRLLLVASAIPIAVLSNVVRITVTSVLHEFAGHRLAELVFHDLAGLLMMPLALGMLFVVLWILSRSFREVPVESGKPFAYAIPNRVHRS
jgi:exosortase